MKRMKYVLPVALAAMAADEPAEAQDDLFLTLSDIEGESLDEKHQNAIDIVAWSWNLSNETDRTQPSASPPDVADIKIIKSVDKASTKLVLALMKGTHIKEGKIFVRRAGECSVDYLEIEMQDVIVSRFSQGGQGGGEAPTETIALNFAEVCLTYKLLEQDCSTKDTQTVCWDIESNTGG